MLGVFSLSEALKMADRSDVDLVLQNEKTDPPLCRLMEWGKYKYELEKRSKAARQKQRAARQAMRNALRSDGVWHTESSKRN